MNTFFITDISIDKHRIDYEYVVEGEWIKYFSLENKFWVEYSEDISGMPKALAAVPLVSNVLPLAALFDANIHVPCLDEDFYYAINDIMNGFAKMYPNLNFHYDNMIACDCIVDTKKDNVKNDKNNALLYFSGGVDAYTSLIRHEHENLILFTVCGADTYYNNKKGILNIMEQNREIAEMHHLTVLSCVSTLRKFINEKELYAYLYPRINDNFWHGFQHGLGMFGLSAGFVHLYDLKTLYFASSFCEKDKNYTCGSDPSIDNFVKVGSARVSHDGYELSRQDKISTLCRYSRENHKKINLRVCYSSSVGDNCCVCEKCIRTMLGILVNNENPKDYGFDKYDRNTIFKGLANAVFEFSDSPEIVFAIYNGIFNQLKEMYSYEEFPDEIKAFYYSDFHDVIRLLNIPRLKEMENHRRFDWPREYRTNDLVYKNYISGDKRKYKRFCKELFEKSELCQQQNVDDWIGNHGLMIDSNGDVSVSGRDITIKRKTEIVVLEGWAADFVNGVPLATIVVKLKNKMYYVDYNVIQLTDFL